MFPLPQPLEQLQELLCIVIKLLLLRKLSLSESQLSTLAFCLDTAGQNAYPARKFDIVQKNYKKHYHFLIMVEQWNLGQRCGP